MADEAGTSERAPRTVSRLLYDMSEAAAMRPPTPPRRRRSAFFTQASLQRAIRAAKAEGFDRIEMIQADGARVVCERSARASENAGNVELD